MTAFVSQITPIDNSRQQAFETLWSDVLSITAASLHISAAKVNPELVDTKQNVNTATSTLLVDASICSFCIHYGHLYRLFCAGKQSVCTRSMHIVPLPDSLFDWNKVL
jgi:hypothetical protein